MTIDNPARLGGATGTGDSAATASSTPVVLMGRIRNFLRLRREAGRAMAHMIAVAVADRVDRVLAAGCVSVVAQDTIEIALTAAVGIEVSTAIAVVAQALAEPLVIGDTALVVDLAIGGAIAAVDGVDELRLIEEAEGALADSIRTGAPAIRTIDQKAAGFDQAALSRDLVTAMRDGELLLHYQPKVHLRRRRITSVEALIRWQHPIRGLIYPNDFIPLAEQTGDIAALTLWAIRRVIVDQQRLDENGHALTVFVNIAGILLTDANFVKRACRLVSESKRSIGFEITETSVIRDAATAIANLKTFDAIGIPIAIDDYGSGLSSLAYLKQLPACELKIDKLFVTQLTSSHRDPLIVRSTIDLSHALEMEVVAEGVESHATLALLSVMGCDMAQGFLISRPLGIEALLAFLEEHREGWQERSAASPLAMFAKRA